MNFIKSRFTGSSARKYSLIVLLAISAFYGRMSLSDKWVNVLSWDMFGYYLYTPATLIWHDPALKNFSKVEEINRKYNNTPFFYQGTKTESGGWMIKYTMGAAVMELPFFTAAHVLAPSQEKDGFSKPYQRAMILSHFFYLILGLFFSRKVLLRFFSDKLTALLLLLIVAGTNYYVSSLTPSVHIMQFCLFSVILYLTARWHEKPAKGIASLLGLVIGLSIILRPPDGLIVLIPLLWNVTSFKTLKEKIKFIFSGFRRDVVLMALFAFCIVFLQLAYWKTVAGSWFLMSYNNNPGEGFELLHPHVAEVLFGFRKGWFIYTPLMIFAVAGFRQMYKRQRTIFWPILIFTVLNVYVVASWSCWWYAGCFGQRAMIESYAVLVLPLGYFLLGAFSSKSKIVQWATGALLLLILVLNIFQSWQYDKGIINADRMTKEYYFRVFGKTEKNNEDSKYLLVDRSQSGTEHFTEESDYIKHIIFADGFETMDGVTAKEQYVDSIARTGKYSLMVDSSFTLSPYNILPYNRITKKDHVWIRTTFWYYAKTDPKQNPLGLVVTFANRRGEGYKYSVTDVGAQPGDSVHLGEWNKYIFDYLSPEIRNENDKINVYFRMRGKQPVYIDDFKVEAYEKADQK